MKTAEKLAGMGAIPTSEGVAFRVWAPNAQAVRVTGIFCDWNQEGPSLEAEENGYWYAFVPKASVGDEYKFLIQSPQDDWLYRNDPYARQLTNSDGNSIIYDSSRFNWQDDSFELPPWNQCIIYEMHIGTFHVTEEGQPGTFASAIEKLPYLKDLGVNVIELMPTAEFPGDYSWGYNPAYPFAVEEAYGGPNALKELVRAAHEHGIGVILDVVYNHFGPTDIDLWRFDGWSENDGGGIYFYNDNRADTPWGSTRPDYGRAEVRNYLRDNALMWLEDFRMDGLRLDGTMFMRSQDGGYSHVADLDIPEAWDFFRDLNNEISTKYPNKLIIAEDLQDEEALTKPHFEGGAGFGSQWWAGFVHPVRKAIITMDDTNRDMETVANCVNIPTEQAFRRVIYTESHDEVANGKSRVAEEIKPGEADSFYSKKRSTLGAGLVFTAAGIPMMFQGQEFLEDRYFSDTEPLQWVKQDVFTGITQLYRDLITLRLNRFGHSKGLTGSNTQIIHLNNEGKVIAYQRWETGEPGDTVMVVANFSSEHHIGYTIGMPNLGLWKVRFNSDWEGYDRDFTNQNLPSVEGQEGETDGMPCYGLFDLPAYTMLVLSQDS
ncbi:alpha-amylase family glycosyl hydrolase [Tunicatimonas pelagia]|uniref:alpha-amylase family glycosyl hydrolase n=1 Tax=Tunicatimonas pelagia TaxID=931531 RepID=UPI0026660A38|nr:alpha-amylase family glycosyl hydrolase [Tunicatimonas pelagia]WKN43216.1 alpha-amylase family glycosyl hydrolase [Tunicatimonas pelagia]